MNTAPAPLVDELTRALEDCGLRLESGPIRSLYSTSAPIYLLTASRNGHEYELVLKDVAWESLLPDARRSRPPFVHDPRREIAMYRAVLAELPGTPRFLMARNDQTSSRSWLLLERVPGRELCEIGDRDEWARALRWLRVFHDSGAGSTPLPADVSDTLLVRDESFYWVWLERAREYVHDERIGQIASGYATVVERLLAQPHTLVHGEFYASNVLVCPQRVCAVDWEMTGFGPPFLDVAALVSGRGWSAEDRRALLREYAPVDDRFMIDFDAARAALAVQWLGWSPTWHPPAERAQDWLAEAIDATASVAASR